MDPDAEDLQSYGLASECYVDWPDTSTGTDQPVGAPADSESPLSRVSPAKW
jgi:hypothetical protein